jgi:hypothetical protein
LILHTPAWHGIHWRDKTEADFWRLNVDGTFWMFQAAQAAGIKRVVFLSSTAWYGHYDKYGFTKRIGEELCEYNRHRHQIRYVAIRPDGFIPWRNFIDYGVSLLYGAVDRDDVLDCIMLAIDKLTPERADGAEPEGIAVNALRANGFTAAEIENWEADPLGTCEAIFPGSRRLIEKYKIDIRRKPGIVHLGESAATLGYAPRRHFGTFLEELSRVDAEGGEEAVYAIGCPF